MHSGPITPFDREIASPSAGVAQVEVTRRCGMPLVTAAGSRPGRSAPLRPPASPGSRNAPSGLVELGLSTGTVAAAGFAANVLPVLGAAHVAVVLDSRPYPPPEQEVCEEQSDVQENDPRVELAADHPAEAKHSICAERDKTEACHVLWPNLVRGRAGVA